MQTYQTPLGHRVSLLGHQLLVRKCRCTDWRGPIRVPLRATENNSWAEVLAIGGKCGTGRKWERKGKRPQEWGCGISDEVKPGVLILFPNYGGAWKAPWWTHETPDYFIDEMFAMAVWNEGESQA